MSRPSPPPLGSGWPPSPITRSYVVPGTTASTTRWYAPRAAAAPAALGARRARPAGPAGPPGLHHHARHAGGRRPRSARSILAEPADRRRPAMALPITAPVSAGAAASNPACAATPAGPGRTSEPGSAGGPGWARWSRADPAARWQTTLARGTPRRPSGSRRRPRRPGRARRPCGSQRDLELGLVAGRRVLLAVELDRHAGRVRHQDETVVLERPVEPLLDELGHVHQEEAVPVLRARPGSPSARRGPGPARWPP